MTIQILAAWLLSLPLLLDGHGAAIPRPAAIVDAIATVALETEDPITTAALLDVLAAHESGYRPHAVGDGGRSVGLFQTQRHMTPRDAIGQARVAVRVIAQSFDRCAAHPLGLYTSGRCQRVWVAERYLAEARGEAEKWME